MIEAMVLAAGVGSRLDPVTRSFPKPALPLGSTTIVGELIGKVAALGVGVVRANLHHAPDRMYRALHESARSVRVDARVEPVLTGPAGALHAFGDVFATAEAVVVISGDLVFDDDLGAMVEAHLSSGAQLTVATTEVLDGHRFGVFVAGAPGAAPSRFVEKPAWAAGTPNRISAGIYVVRPSLLDRVPRGQVHDFGADLIPVLVTEPGALHLHPLKGCWDDVGDIDAYRRVALRQAAPRYVDDRARVDPTAELLGVVHVARGASIGAGAVVRDSVVLPGAVVPDGQTVAGAVIGTTTHTG